LKDDLVTLRLKATEERLGEVSKSFCLAKWYQVTLHLHNGQSQSCHHVKATEIARDQLAENPSALHNTPTKMKAREQMIHGQRPKECSYCWKIEDRGRVSDRVMKSSETWAEPYLRAAVESGRGEKILPKYVEISFDSVCNFKCMYCGPAYSSSWMKEVQQQGAYPTSTRFNSLNIARLNGSLPLAEPDRQSLVESFWRWWPELVPGLDTFRVTGGEPFLAQETWKLLEWIGQNPQPQLKLALNSNLSLRGEKFEQMVQALAQAAGQVKRLSLFTSCDTWGERAEYIRYGLDFALFQKNFESLLARVETPMTLSLMMTVNALSLSKMQPFLAWILEMRVKYPRHWVGFDTPYLQNPKFMSIEILPAEFAQYLESCVQMMASHAAGPGRPGFWSSEIVKVDRLKELILQPTLGTFERFRLQRDFYKMFTEYDARRGLQFLNVFPEYAEFWKTCGSRAII
jgi:organic radical activating enzyme